MGTYFETRLVHVPSLRCSQFFSLLSRMPKSLPSSSLVLQKARIQMLDRKQGNLIEASRAFSQLLHTNTWTEPQIRQGMLPSTFLLHFNPLFNLSFDFKKGTKQLSRYSNSLHTERPGVRRPVRQ